MHIPFGLLMDRIGVKKVLSICILLTSVGLLPLLYSDSWSLVVAGRFLVGSVSSAAVISVFKVIRIGFGEEKFGRIFGFTATIGIFGAAYGGGPTHALVETFGWQNIIAICVIFGIAFSIIVFLFMSKSFDTPEDLNEKSNILHDIKEVALNKNILAISVAGGLMVAVLEGFVDAWSVTFFKFVYNMEGCAAANLSSIVPLSMCIGTTVMGFIIDKTGKHYLIIILSGIFMILGFSLFLYTKCSIELLYFCMFVIGFASAYQVAIISKARSFSNSSLADLTATTSNMIVMIFGLVFHSLIGTILEYKIGGQINASNALEGFQYSFSVIPLFIFIAIIIILFMQRSESKKTLL